jgi:hypothetical protein
VYVLPHVVASNVVQEFLPMTTQINSLLKTGFVWYHVLFKIGLKFQFKVLTMFYHATTNNQAMLGVLEPVSWQLFLPYFLCMLCETKNIYKKINNFDKKLSDDKQLFFFI